MTFKYQDDRSNARYSYTGKKRDGRKIYFVEESFSYEHGKFLIVVPRGFLTDLASIPSIPFMPKPGASLWDDAAIVHDRALHSSYNITREEADDLFYYALLDRGCTRFTATVLWLAVRIGSFIFGEK